jgi:hypothetical protein
MSGAGVLGDDREVQTAFSERGGARVVGTTTRSIEDVSGAGL